MSHAYEHRAAFDARNVGNARSTIAMLASMNGVTGEREPIDDFADAVNRLCDEDVPPDQTERLLIGLARRGVVTDDERFALHAAYLLQLADGL